MMWLWPFIGGTILVALWFASEAAKNIHPHERWMLGLLVGTFWMLALLLAITEAGGVK